MLTSWHEATKCSGRSSERGKVESFKVYHSLRVYWHVGRYCNMDYIFYKSLVDCKVTTLNVSYNIACQWAINLWRRMNKLDSSFYIFGDHVNIRYLILKFHLPAHIAACHTWFAFNYTKGVGHTDREALERGWAKVNPLASSTKEMGSRISSWYPGCTLQGLQLEEVCWFWYVTTFSSQCGFH